MSLESHEPQLERAMLTIRKLRSKVEELQRAKAEPIAVIGLGCRFPGGDGPAGYWRMLRDGTDAVSEVPPDRWNIDDYYDPEPGKKGKMSTRYGGFLRDVDRFDAAFFAISGREAERMDPQQRLFLEVCWEALEHAGIAPLSLQGSQTGVFTGIPCSYYWGNPRDEGNSPDAWTLTGNASNAAPGRLSYFLGLQGPSVAIDTACSSALVAVHLACHSLRLGEVNLALAAGVNLILNPSGSVALSQMKVLSPDGRCKSFDRSANGYVRGEGCGVVVLKRLADAERDGERVLALICGSAVNQDGRSSGFTVPSGMAQQAVIRAALHAAGVKREQIGYVEAHGTGTPLGDPIEMEALVEVLCAGAAPRNPLVVGSAKTNFGHLEAAAGIAGLIKVVLSLGTGQIPPHLHFSDWNPHISLQDAPLVVPTALIEWPASYESRLAGVSSFGMSGTNAHVVLEQAPPRAAMEAAMGPHVLTLSAKDTAALSDFACRVDAFLGESPGLSLSAVCYTSNVRRSHFPCRLAIVAESIPELRQRLAAGESRTLSDDVPADRLARQYMAGANVDWSSFYQGRVWPPVDLPTYPFQRQSYWMAPEPESAAPVSEARAVHPLLGACIDSAGREIVFQSRLSIKTAPYMADHKVFEMVVVPAVTYMELARAAAAQSFPGSSHAVVDLLLREPLLLDGNHARTLQVVISPDDGDAGAGFGIFSRGDDKRFIQHASGRLSVRDKEHRAAVFMPDEVKGRCTETIEPREIYAQAREQGLMLGSLFMTLREIWRGSNEALARVVLPAELLSEAESYGAHPCLLDGCLQVVAVALSGSDAAARLYLPFGLERMELLVERMLSAVWCNARVRDAGTPAGETLTADVTVVDDEGLPVAELRGLSLKSASRDALRRAGEPNWRDWLYHLVWEDAPLGTNSQSSRDWLIFGQPGGVADELKKLLEAAGSAVRVTAGCSDARELAAAGKPFGIAWLNALDTGGFSDASELMDLERSLCAEMQALLREMSNPVGSCRLVVVTRGARAVRGDEKISIAQAALWGLARVIRMEYPALHCVSVDLDPEEDELAHIIATELKSALSEDEVAWRGANRSAGRLERHRVRAGEHRLAGAWLIAGGLGALGLQLAAWLVTKGVRELVLIGRSKPDTAALTAIGELERSGAIVQTECVDITDAAAVNELIAGTRDLRGVVHAAGVVDDGMLMRQTPEQFARVLAPKVAGAWNLHLATRGRQLDHFVLFSSTAAILGSPGQGNYAAANSFLEALAHYRRASGLPALSINWGPWAGAGMTDELDDPHRRRRRKQGITDIEPRMGLAVFGELLRDSSAQVTVLHADWELMLRQFPAGAEPTILAHLGNAARTARERQAGAPRGHLLRAVESAAPPQRRTVLISLLRQEIARVLALEPSVTIGLAQPLSELGLDSLMAVELRNTVASGLGLTLASTTLFDYPRLDALAGHIESQLFPPELREAVEASAESSLPNLNPVASDDFGDLLATIESLDESDVRDMLTRKS
jgi:acyl transferase domain-containing protein